MVILLVAILLEISKASGGKCRGLALSPGGSHGAYEAGAFDSFVKTLPAEEYAYDIVTGVSIGAINAGLISLFPKSDELAANDILQEFWQQLTPDSVYTRKWPMLYNFFFGSSLMDNKPLNQTLQPYLDKYSRKRPVILGATNLDTGEFVHLPTTTREELNEAMISSSSIPILFPPHQWLNQTWADGGIIKHIDISSSVLYCIDQGYKEEDIIIDAIFCNGSPSLSVENDEFAHVWDVYERMRQIDEFDKKFWQIDLVMSEYPNVNFRYFVLPSQEMKSGFDHAVIMDRLELGKNDALEVLTNTSGNARELLKHLRA